MKDEIVYVYNALAEYAELISFAPTNKGPKEYGQWLQQTGRQKWVKAKRKK